MASNGQSYSMGYIQSKPVASDGTLSLRYRNGDLCHKGTENQAHRSTRINFFCSAVNVSFMQEIHLAILHSEIKGTGCF